MRMVFEFRPGPAARPSRVVRVWCLRERVDLCRRTPRRPGASPAGSHPPSGQTARCTGIRTPTSSPRTRVPEAGGCGRRGFYTHWVLPDLLSPRPQAFPQGGAGSSLPHYLLKSFKVRYFCPAASPLPHLHRPTRGRRGPCRETWAAAQPPSPGGAPPAPRENPVRKGCARSQPGSGTWPGAMRPSGWRNLGPGGNSQAPSAPRQAWGGGCRGPRAGPLASPHR